MLVMWSCDFFLLPYMVITIKLAKSYWCIWCYIPFWLVFWAKFRNVIYVVMWLHTIAIYGNPSNWLNVIDLCDVIYHSDWFFELSSEMLFMWSCDFILLPYMAITIKLAKSYQYIILYTILTGLLSWVQKCHLYGHVTAFYCHIR